VADAGEHVLKRLSGGGVKEWLVACHDGNRVLTGETVGSFERQRVTPIVKAARYEIEARAESRLERGEKRLVGTVGGDEGEEVGAFLEAALERVDGWVVWIFHSTVCSGEKL
jgi:hypothetical protein